tara:strand:+ start:2227 stop:2445 length:219 start_codon:yes stop_codon:yes gene_type:complete
MEKNDAPNVPDMLAGVSCGNQHILDAGDCLRQLNKDYILLTPREKDEFVAALHSDRRSKLVLQLGVVPHPFD